MATNRIVTPNRKKLIHRLEVFGNQLERHFSGQAPEPVLEEEPKIPGSAEQVLENWLEFSQAQPTASRDLILAGPYKGKQDPAQGSLDLLDSFLSGDK